MNPILLITRYSIWIAGVIIIAFVIYWFMNIFSKSKKHEEEFKEETIKEIKKAVGKIEREEKKEQLEKDNPLKRMKRGFGVMRKKLQESQLIKNYQDNSDDDLLGLKNSFDFSQFNEENPDLTFKGTQGVNF